MTTIWKYPIEVTGYQQVEMPIKSKVLSVQIQHERPCIWVQVNPDETDTCQRAVYTKGTGHPIIGIIGNFVGTYQLENGSLVFHVFCI